MRIRHLALLACLVACAGRTTLIPPGIDEATLERELQRRFGYGPPTPLPVVLDDPAAGQVADATYFAAFPDYDRSYTPAARAEAHRLAARLRDDAAALTHEQFVLRVAEIVALADNAHTALGENAFRKDTPRIPVRTYEFADGLHVLQADRLCADLLGARIDAIDGRPVAAIQADLARYAGGTDAHRRRHLVAMLESPALLHAAGLADHRDRLTLRGVLASGEPFARTLDAEVRGRSAWVASSARLLFPRPDGDRMVSLLSERDELPVWLRRRRSLFSLDRLPDDGLYIGLSHNADTDDEPIGPFLEQALQQLDEPTHAYIVLDVRLNGGGDYTRTYAFARALPARAAGAPIYVLTSSWTFSAAITTVAALKDAGGDQVVIVGEPVGDRLRFWAEGKAFELPNAFLSVHYATGRHDYTGPCLDPDTCFWLNERYPVRVATLVPEIAVPFEFRAYRERRDPAVEAARHHFAAHHAQTR